jgi:hypothetical protein
MKNFIQHKILDIKWITILLEMAFLFNQRELRAQYISNDGAHISITSGTVIGADTITNNNTATLINDGTLAIYTLNNAGTTQGDGTYILSGNFINTGIFINGTSTVNMNGTSTQSISAANFYILKLSGSGEKSFLISTAIANNFEIEGTAVVRLGDLNHTANKLFLGTIGQAASGYGSTASTAIFKIAQYFGSTDTGILNVATSAVICTDGVWLGASSSHWNIASNWCNSIIPDLTLDVIIPSTAPIQPITGVASAKARSLTIHAGATLTISGAGLLEVTGDWINNGTFNPGLTSTVEFKGAANSTINAGSFANLSFTGTGTKTINGTLTVSRNITPVSTAVILSDSNSLTLNTGRTMEITGSFTTGASSKVILAPNSNYLNRSTSNPRLEVQQLFTGAKGWRLIGSPVASTYASMTTGFETQGFAGSSNPSLQPNLLWWNETDKGTTLQGWRQSINLSNTVPAGRGHYFYIFNGAAKPSPVTGNYTDILPLTMSTTGTEVNLSSGFFDFGITFTARDTNMIAQVDKLIEVNQADEGFNLIANPTASMLDWDAGSGWTKTNMDASIYVWDPATSSFLTWNGATGTLEDGLIAPYQGFWVRSNAASPSLLLTGNGAKTLTNQSIYGRKIGIEEPSVIHLEVNGENLQAETFISFGEDGLEGTDPKDAYQLESLAEDWLLLYSYGSINKRSPLVINHLDPLDGNGKVIPLHLAASSSGKPINGSYLMNWTLPTNLPAEVTVILMDHISQKAIDMRKESAHAFSFEAPRLPNARTGKTSDPLAIPQAVVFQSPYETGEVNTNARKVSDKPQRPFTILISGKANEEIGYLADLPKLFGPVPNPFNAQTKIRFYLPETQNAEIQITDMLGQVVGSFPSDRYKAGIHELEWIPSTIQIPHGMYVIRLGTESYQVSQKLIKN